MSEKKRERGANYTVEEKALLVDLVAQFKNIIEDKRTCAVNISKKQEAWKAIAIKFNSNCTSGPRKVDHLKALYDNMKQKARKNVGESNKMAYIKKQQPQFTDSEIKQALDNIKEDKVQMTKTGGGTWAPKTTDSNTIVLSIIQDQVEPLPNPYDSGAAYFEDEAIPSTSAAVVTYADYSPINMNTAEVPDNILYTTPRNENPQPNCDTPKKKNRRLKNKTVIRQLKNRPAEEYKRLYFKRKCINANLEKKKLMQEILQNQKLFNLKMAIKKKKLDLLK